MARPREFDTNEVLWLVMEVFWDKGYKNTSYVDLEGKTGVKKASLVAAYGDKHALFIRAVEKYLLQGKVILQEAFSEADSVNEGLRNWLETMVNNATTRGCLATNTIIEMASTDPDAAGLLKKHIRATEKTLAEKVAAGIESGEFQSTVPPKVAAKFLMTWVCGLNVVGRTGLPKKELTPVIEIILDSLN